MATLHISPAGTARVLALCLITTLLLIHDARGQCAPSTTSIDLATNNVRATLLAGADMWWDLTGNPGYEVPANSGKHSLFASSLWIGGIDGNGQIKTAAQTYRQTGNDFWPGPVDTTNASVTPAVCLNYAKHWSVTRAEVAAFAAGGPATNVIQTWPGNGNPSANQGHYLAPFVDVNADGLYNYLDGDYPAFDLAGTGTECCNWLHGDQSVWWVINDVGNIHSETFSPAPIGLEIHCQAFAFSAPGTAVDDATFYRYRIINRSSIPLLQTFFGQWSDADVGSPADDFVGCDVSRGLGYCYNSTANDAGSFGYGLNPPAVGIDLLQGPVADVNDGIDNDLDGCIDCTLNPGGMPGIVGDDTLAENWTMSRFIFYNNLNGTPNGNPVNGYDFYSYLTGTWLDGLQMTYGGDGRDPNNPPCHFMFPDSTDPSFPGQPWTEITAGNNSSDRRFLMSAGPFSFDPGEVNCITLAVAWARDPAWVNSGITGLQQADDELQDFFDNCFTFPTGIATHDRDLQLRVAPNPFHDFTVVTLESADSGPYRLDLYNTKGAVVRSITIHPGMNRVDRASLAPGIYLYTLTGSQSRTLRQGKLVTY